MKDLRLARQGWDERLMAEAAMLRKMTIFESVAEMESLYSQFKSQMDADDHLFFPERVAYLTEMQVRLGKLADLLRRRNLG
jgi:hypothetical protein